jgi:hypothetical protein
LALPVLVFGAGPDTPQDQEVVGLSWEAGQGRTVFVAVLSGYCIGQPKPTLEVRKNEPGAGAKFPRGAVVLEAVVKRPDSSSAAQPEFEPGQPVPICNGLALRLTKTVRLNRPIGDRPVLERLDGQLRRAPKLP